MRKRWVAMGAGLAMLAAIAASLLSTAPSVSTPTAPRSTTAVMARALYERLNMFKKAPEDAPAIVLPQAELDAALRVAGRVLPGLRARGSITTDALTVATSLPLPGGLWLNATGSILPAPSGFRLAELRLGSLPLPPDTTLWLATALGDALLGGEAASHVLAAMEPLDLRPGRARVTVALPLAEREALAARVEAAMQRVAVPFDTGQTERLLDQMAAAEIADTLRNGGSLLAWMRFALREAPNGGTAILALAVACGDPTISQVLGWRAEEHPVACGRTMLRDRYDLRQHFVISAGLEVATTLGSAVAVGELKELYDSRPRGSGFSFDDLAANRAGIAFARRVMGTDAATRAALADRLTRESMILPPIDDLDSGLTEAQFTALYGDLDSPAYAEAISEIDRRIAELGFYGEGEG